MDQIRTTTGLHETVVRIMAVTGLKEKNAPTEKQDRINSFVF